MCAAAPISFPSRGRRRRGSCARTTCSTCSACASARWTTAPWCSPKGAPRRPPALPLKDEPRRHVPQVVNVVRLDVGGVLRPGPKLTLLEAVKGTERQPDVEEQQPRLERFFADVRGVAEHV